MIRAKSLSCGVERIEVVLRSIMQNYIHTIKEIAEKVGCQSVRKIAAHTGVLAVYRITVYYLDMRAADSVATLARHSGNVATLETIYRGHFGNKPLVRQMDLSDYDLFAQAFRPSIFDTLPDQPDIPSYGVALCLIERGAGSFSKGIITTTQTTTEKYTELLDTIRNYMPEALREIK